MTLRFAPAPDVFRTEVGSHVRAFPAPPSDFDPRSATPRDLARHGLPRRPDPETEPYLAARWGDLFGHPLSIVGAEFGTHVRAAPATGAAAAPDYSVDGWAGVGRRMAGTVFRGPDPYISPATFVSAQWTLPKLMGDPTNGDDFLMTWVGLDGFKQVDEDYNPTGTGQVLRAGMSAIANGHSFDWVAWAEWYSAEFGAVGGNVSNFPAQSGDKFGVVVCVGPPTSATVFFANLSRNHGTSVGLQAPYPTSGSNGVTAEWIVEGGDPSISLPFAPITFEECVAGSTQELVHLTPHGIITNMFEVLGLYDVGPNVTQTTITSPTTAVVEWIGAPA